MSLGVLFSLLAAVGYSLRSFLYKSVIKEGVSRNFYLLSYRFISIPYSLFLIWILKEGGVNSQVGHSNYVLIIISVLISFVADIVYYKGFSRVQMSLASIFSRIAPVLSLFISIIFFKETPRINAIIGIALIVTISLWLIRSLDRKEPFGNDKKGIFSVLSGQVLYTINGNFVRYFYHAIGGFSYMFYFSIISTILYFITYLKSKEKFSIDLRNKKGVMKLILLDVISVLAFSSSIIAFGNIIAPVAYAFTSFGFIFTLFLGYFFLGERDNLLRKIIATITMIVGGFMISA